jgi:hypothetical protein
MDRLQFLQPHRSDVRALVDLDAARGRAALKIVEKSPAGSRRRGFITSVSRLGDSDVQVFGEKPPVVYGHFHVVLLGDWVAGVIGSLLEHFRFLPKYSRLGHGVLPRA